MTRPRCCSPTCGLLVVEHRTCRLSKRARFVSRQGAVPAWSSFKHLRFATPARAVLHDLQPSMLSRCLGPGRDCACLSSVLTDQTHTMLAEVGVHQ
jgi:hypothetical protein